MNKRGVVFVLGLFMVALILMGFTCKPKQEAQTDEEYREEIIALSAQVASEVNAPKEKSMPVEVASVERVTVDKTFLEEFDLLAKCVEAEAGNQDQLGKRLVVDVILNRVDSMDFPDDIISVINQPGQFSVVGYLDQVKPSEDTINAVKLELERRTDTVILYFRTGGYHSFCTPDYQHGAHYFGH